MGLSCQSGLLSGLLSVNTLLLSTSDHYGIGSYISCFKGRNGGAVRKQCWVRDKKAKSISDVLPLGAVRVGVRTT